MFHKLRIDFFRPRLEAILVHEHREGVVLRRLGLQGFPNLVGDHGGGRGWSNTGALTAFGEPRYYAEGRATYVQVTVVVLSTSQGDCLTMV